MKDFYKQIDLLEDSVAFIYNYLYLLLIMEKYYLLFIFEFDVNKILSI